MRQSTDHNPPSPARRAVSGGVLLAVGVLMLAIGWDYPVGRVTQMGPGFIPRVIGLLICALSLAILAIDLTSTQLARAERLHWRGLIFVTAAIVAFGVLIEPVGLLPSMFMAVAVSMFADDDARPLTVLIYATLATLGGWLLFVVTLELPIPAFWR